MNLAKYTTTQEISYPEAIVQRVLQAGYAINEHEMLFFSGPLLLLALKYPGTYDEDRIIKLIGETYSEGILKTCIGLRSDLIGILKIQLANRPSMPRQDRILLDDDLAKFRSLNKERRSQTDALMLILLKRTTHRQDSEEYIMMTEQEKELNNLGLRIYNVLAFLSNDQIDKRQASEIISQITNGDLGGYIKLAEYLQ